MQCWRCCYPLQSPFQKCIPCARLKIAKKRRRNGHRCSRCWKFPMFWHGASDMCESCARGGFMNEGTLFQNLWNYLFFDKLQFVRNGRGGHMGVTIIGAWALAANPEKHLKTYGCYWDRFADPVILGQEEWQKLIKKEDG